MLIELGARLDDRLATFVARWSRYVFTVPQKSVSSRPRMTSACAISARRALGLVERMARREIHAAAPDRSTGACSSFGELDQERHARRRARAAVGDDHRILGGDQQPRRFARPRRSRPAAAPSASASECAAALRPSDRLFLQFAVGDDQHRLMRRRHRDLVGAHRATRRSAAATPACRPT